MLIQIIKQPMQTKNIHYKGRVYINFLGPFPTIPDEVERGFIENYLSTLTHYPYIGDEKLQDGVEVVEGADYKLQKQVNTSVFHESMGGQWWENVEEFRYERALENRKRIVAIGIPQSTHEGEEQVIYDSGRMRKEDVHNITTKEGQESFQKELAEFLSKKTEEKETQKAERGYWESFFENAQTMHQQEFIDYHFSNYLITRKP